MASPLFVDMLALALCAVAFAGYQLVLVSRCRREPQYSVQQLISAARVAWVETVMRERRDILAVQTLRNSIMAASFLASTAILLIVGVLTLSAQSDKLSGAWHALNVVDAVDGQLWLIKLLFMLLDLLVAFFSFSMAIRLFHHVGYWLNVPQDNGTYSGPAYVAAQLNRAGRFYSIGTRAYYLLVPLLFWLFGPHFLTVATLVLLWVLWHLDRAPRAPADLAG